MESTLHHQLKHIYAVRGARTEVKLGRFRIDVVLNDELIEIQHASLSSIRSKVGSLLVHHQVKVVKPIVDRKYLVAMSRKNGRVLRRRLSPKRGKLIDVFDELVHFGSLFPHPNLTLEVPILDIEEYRYPGHGRRRRWRRTDFVVQDRKLLELKSTHEFRIGQDLRRLVQGGLPSPFETADLAKTLNVNRSFAQRIAYCLNKTKTASREGKRGNAWLYEFADA